MDIFGFLSLVGGLALFLYGMHVMGGGLEKLSGGKLERVLEKLTSNPLKAVLLGAGVVCHNRYAGRLCQFWDYEAFPGNWDYYGSQHRYHYDVMAFEPDRD